MKGEIAGKTGTTNENSDGWFLGCVPRLVTACWVGGEENRIHFAGTALGQGAASALPIWALYMRKVYDDPTLNYSESEKFDIPEDALKPPVDEDLDGEDGNEDGEGISDEEREELDEIFG